MSLRYDTYGFRRLSINDACKAIENTLDVKFIRRNSGYYAGDYFMFRGSSGGGMRIYNNRDKDREILIRGEYNEYNVIFEMFELDNMEELHNELIKKLSDIILLQSEMLEDDEI